MFQGTIKEEHIGKIDAQKNFTMIGNCNVIFEDSMYKNINVIIDGEKVSMFSETEFRKYGKTTLVITHLSNITILVDLENLEALTGEHYEMSNML